MICVSVTVLEFLLNLNSLQSGFSQFFLQGCSGEKLSAHFVVECPLTILGHSRYMS